MNLIDSLYRLNRWWETGKVDETHLYKRIRSEFSGIMKNLSGMGALAVTGPTGCGKTGLLYQSVDYLLKLRVPPARVLLLLGDEPSLFLQNKGLSGLLQAYAATVLKEELLEITAPVYIFIDDFQRFHEGRELLQRYGMTRVKFILSAPSRSQLFHIKDEGDALLTEIRVAPLSPGQFTEFCVTYRQSNFDSITFKSLLPRGSLFDNPREYAAALLVNRNSLMAFHEDRRLLLGSYLLAGGYPGFFACESPAVWQKKLFEETIDRCLYTDILSSYTVKSPEKLKLLLYLLAAGDGDESSFAGLGKQLSLNTVTAISDTNLLSQSGLVVVCENDSGKKTGISRKNKRIFLRDSGIKNALLRRPALDAAELAREIKNALIALAADYVEKEGGRVCFWRSGQNEVDIVVDKDYERIPIEVLCRDTFTRRDLRGINAYMRVNNGDKGIVITKDLLSYDHNLFFIPYWLL